MFCPKCGKKMETVMSFEVGKSGQFHRCKCGFTTRMKRIHFEEIVKDGDGIAGERRRKTPTGYGRILPEKIRNEKTSSGPYRIRTKESRSRDK